MCSSSSTWMGVMTLNRYGYLAIVSLMSLYWRSLQGTVGTGKAVSMYVTDGEWPTSPVLNANLINCSLLPSSCHFFSPPFFPLVQVVGTFPLRVLSIAHVAVVEEPARVVGAPVASIKLPTQLGTSLPSFLSAILSSARSTSPCWLTASSFIQSRHSMGQVLEGDIQELMGVAEVKAVMLMKPFLGGRVIANDS